MKREATDASVELSSESLQRLTSFLLIIATGLLTAVIGLSLYIYLDKLESAELKASLLSQQQLQQQLLAGQASDHAPFPHLVPGISFVLNPAMHDSTWKTGENTSYRINRIGLRGKEIDAKAEHVKRILLVGDSVLFGWKLGDEDRLESLLQALADQQWKAGKYEFVTVALPGWNTLDQERFLRSHLARLDPDYIIWSIIRNDLLDSGGVTPPGMLATWNSPQKEAEQPFQFLPPALLRDAPAPLILSRWQSNLRLIDSFASEFGIPTTMLWWRARHRAIFEYVLARSGVELPVLYVPYHFRYDDENWCVAYPDCHPTRWANERLAIAIMDELARRKSMPQVAWNQAELAVADAFRLERDKMPSAAEQQAFMAGQAAKVPDTYSDAASGPVLFGIHDNRMQRNGLLLLRKPGSPVRLAMELAPLWQRPGAPLQVILKVSNSSGDQIEDTYSLDPGSNRIEMNLPLDRNFGLYQVEWLFSYSECERPSACFSAEIKSAQLLEISAP